MIQEIEVKHIIIGKQFENSENYQKLIKLAQIEKISLHIVEAGQEINIEKGLYFNILWPSSDNVINENALNNNSLVCKLNYKEFSMLFTGDIEEIAEREIIKKYNNNKNLLKSTILKVGHHGSKTSSTKEFLNITKPQYALIGVGKNNKFGHPNPETLENLKIINCKYFRTDECGEITVKINGRSIKIENFIQKD